MQSSDNSTSSISPQVIKLASLGIIQVSGDDAADFLHSLLTNDIKNLTLNETRLCGLCNPKGRLFAIISVVRREQDYLLLLPNELADFIQQRLSLFILRSKVTISRVDEMLRVFALLNTNLSTFTEQQFTTEQQTIAAFPAITSSLICVVNNDSADDFVNRLNENGWQSAPEHQWGLSLIQAGIAQVFAASKEAFTPQQVNLDLVGGVSFKKGCYPGQEVVARLHYLGSPSRRLYTATMTTESLPLPNTDVLDASGEVMGQVVQAVFTEQKQVLLQLSMKLALIDRAGFISEQMISALTPCHTEEPTCD